MHYANGREARIGDVVKGKGYNVKHEIIGILVAANPAATACNCTVVCVGVGLYGYQAKKVVNVNQNGFVTENGQICPEPISEYGQLDAFVALDPKTGEVLPADEHLAPVKSKAQAAYERYSQFTGGKSAVTGDSLPAWEALPDAVRSAWSAAVPQ